MAISVVMPALEMAQETGKLLAWRKKEGDRVTRGEVLFEVETDKAVVEIEALASGILAGISSYEDAVVPVGVTIAWIVAPGEQPPAASEGPAPSARATAAPSPPSTAAAQAPVPSATQAVQMSPKARRLAKERGVDVSRMRGTGPDGSITTDDVLSAAQPQAADPRPDSQAPAGSGALRSVPRLMAERTTQSWTTVPHFFLVREVDAGALIRARDRSVAEAEKSGGVPTSFSDFLVLLTARILEKHPLMNASWVGDAVRLNPEVNVSLAIAVSNGVVAAVIPRANVISLREISTERAALAERARAGRLRPSDVAGGTFTISNLGMYKVDSFTAIVAPPQAAILAVGAIAQRVVAVDGQPAVRPMMTLTLSTDHRIADGARAALFLNDLVEAIHTAN